ncbi:MAG TPA: FAD binding domain-containing protein [Acidobacteriota bacterium]|jgi:4-hydroxybenzoyl-CoA reductase subunit beta
MTTLPEFEVYIPESVKDALAFLSEHNGRAKIVAGGTDLLPSLKQRLFEPQFLIDIKPLVELQGIRTLDNGDISIGALTTITEIATNAYISTDLPVLQQAATTVAGPSLRNVGTIGGNVCLDTRCYWYNQSYFWRASCGFCIKKDGSLCHVAPGSKTCWAVYSADTPAALLTLDAKLRLSSASGDRLLSSAEFFLNDGLQRNVMHADELLTEILIPAASRGYAGRYEKFRLRGSVDYPLAGVAIAAKKTNGSVEDLRVALTAVNPRPVMLADLFSETLNLTGQDLIDEVKKLAMKTAKPLKTSASTMEYRRHMLGVMIKRSLQSMGIQ